MSLDDFDLSSEDPLKEEQVEATTIETLKEDSGNTLPYLVDEDVNLKNKKHKLLQSKRYHSNAAKAYSYHLEKAG